MASSPETCAVCQTLLAARPPQCWPCYWEMSAEQSASDQLWPAFSSDKGLLCRYGVGSRFKLKHTRAIVNAIHSGVLGDAEYQQTPIFDLHVSARLLLQMRRQQLAISAAECSTAFVGERRHQQLATVAAKLSQVLCGLRDSELAPGCTAWGV